MYLSRAIYLFGFLFSLLFVYKNTLDAPSSLNYPEWPFYEWLINYQVGFVRRGLVGSIINYFSFGKEVQALNTLVFFSYLIFSFLISLFLAINVTAVRSAILLVFCPFGLYWISLSNEYYFNKEILFYIAILFTSMMYIFFKDRKSLLIKNTIILFIFLISGLLLLVHEAFLFFGAFIFSLIIFKLYSPQSPPQIGKIVAIIFIKFCLVIFAILVYYKGDLTTSEAIWLSLSDQAKEISGNAGPAGGIVAIGWSLLTGLSLSIRALLSGLASYYIFSFILIYLFLGFILFEKKGEGERGAINLSKIYLSKKLLLPLSIVALTFSPLFILGWDWGRWVMGIYYIQLIIFLLELDEVILQFFKKNFTLTKKFSFIYFIILLFLALITRVPGCCFNASGNSALNNPALLTIKNYLRIIGEYFNIYFIPFNL